MGNRYMMHDLPFGQLVDAIILNRGENKNRPQYLIDEEYYQLLRIAIIHRYRIYNIDLVLLQKANPGFLARIAVSKGIDNIYDMKITMTDIVVSFIGIPTHLFHNHFIKLFRTCFHHSVDTAINFYKILKIVVPKLLRNYTSQFQSKGISNELLIHRLYWCTYQ
jgi:hypothetical protein